MGVAILLNGDGYSFVTEEDRQWVMWIAEAYALRDSPCWKWMWESVPKSWIRSTLADLMLAGF